MASFLQPSADPFGQMQLYQPDWSFLTQVMGHKQAEYDRGFNMVQSAYSSILNSPLSNPDNEEFRQDAFNKLQKSLRSVSALDLSNPGNIQKAMKLIEPLAKDQDLAYDIMWTKESQKELEKLNYHKTHLDPEVRKLYNPYAEQYMQLGQERMQGAKRGDGSMRQVSPLEFIPFFDMNEFLDKRAKANGLKITHSETSGGYIIERVNGEGAVPAFSTWAAQQLGDQFDRQIGVMAEVTAETSIRSQMEQGMSREDAINSLVGEFVNENLRQEKNNLRQVRNHLNSVNVQIERYAQQEYITQRQAENLKILLEQKGMLEDGLSNIQDNITSLESNEEFVFGNLNGIIANTLKESSILNWALTHAIGTQSTTLKADQVVLTHLRMNQAERFHNQKMALEYEKFLAGNRQFWAKHELDSYKALGVGTHGATKSSVPLSDGLFFTPTKTITPQGEAVSLPNYFDSLIQSENNIIKEIPNFLGMIVGEEESYNLTPVINQYMNNGSLSEDNKKLLTGYVKNDLGYTGFFIDDNSENRRAHLLNIASYTVNKASNNITSDGEYSSGEIANFKRTIENAENYLNQIVDVRENLADITEEMLKWRDKTSDKRRKRQRFEDIDIIAYTPGNRPIADMSQIDKKHIAEYNIDKFIKDSDFQSQVPVSPSGVVQNIPLDFLSLLTHEEYYDDNKNTRKFYDNHIKDKNYEVLRKSLNDNLTISFDMLNDQLILTPKLDAGKGEHVSETIKVPFNEILSTDPHLHTGLKELIHHQRDKRSVAKSSLDPALKGESVKAPTYQKKLGFDWTLFKNSSGNLEVSFKMNNPQKNEKDIYETHKFNNLEGSDNEKLIEINRQIEDFFESYLETVSIYNAEVKATSVNLVNANNIISSYNRER